MLSFSGSLKVFVALEACDMRKGFNGLYAAVTERLGEDPRGGALFVALSRSPKGIVGGFFTLNTRIVFGHGRWQGTSLRPPSAVLLRGTGARRGAVQAMG